MPSAIPTATLSSRKCALASTFDGPVNFVVGAFYQKDKTKFCVAQLLGFVDFTIDSATIFGDAHFFNNNPQVLCNRQNAKSYAGYGDLNFAVNDRLTLGAGLRWTREKKDWAGRNQRFVFALGPDTTHRRSVRAARCASISIAGRMAW